MEMVIIYSILIFVLLYGSYKIDKACEVNHKKSDDVITLFFWTRNPKINNVAISNQEISDKFVEECSEVVIAWSNFTNEANFKNCLLLFGEIFDVFQVLILMFRRSKHICRVNEIDIEEVIQTTKIEHTQKRIDRKWDIDVKEYYQVSVVKQDEE